MSTVFFNYLNNLPQDQQNELFKDQCGICLEKEPTEDLIAHNTPERDVYHDLFHRSCLKEWVKDHGTCPICHAQVSFEKGSALAETVLEKVVRIGKKIVRNKISIIAIGILFGVLAGAFVSMLSAVILGSSIGKGLGIVSGLFAAAYSMEFLRQKLLV